MARRPRLRYGLGMISYTLRIAGSQLYMTGTLGGAQADVVVELGEEPIDARDFAMRMKSAERAIQAQLLRPAAPAPEA